MCGGGDRSMKTEGGGRTGVTHTLVVVTYSGWSDFFPFKDIKSILQ